jgi:chromosome segregation ATPase
MSDQAYSTLRKENDELRNQLAEAREQWGNEKMKRIEYSEQLAEIEQDRDQLKQQLLACEGHRMLLLVHLKLMDDDLAENLPEYERLEGTTELLYQMPSLALTEALKPVREALNDCQISFKTNEWDYAQMEVSKAISELDKLCPKGPQ